MAKVSIIIATHSRPHLLPRAVQSAQQAGQDVEVIVVDDASTDETAQVCRTLPNIRYVRVERNQRTAGARNLGIVASSGEYIGFLDDDDLRLPDSVDLQAQALDAHPEAGMVYGQVLFGDQNCVPLNHPPQPETCHTGDIFWQLLEYQFLFCQCVIFRKSCLYKVGLLNKDMPGYDDADMWLRIAELYPAIAVEQPVAIWRVPVPDSGQGSSNTAQFVLKQVPIHKNRWLTLPRAQKDPARSAQVRHRFINCMADMLAWHALDAVAHHQPRAARQHLMAALRFNPQRMLRPATLRLYLRTFLPSPTKPPTTRSEAASAVDKNKAADRNKPDLSPTHSTETVMDHLR